MKSEQINHWRREKPLEMQIVLNRFCKCVCEFYCFCVLCVGEIRRKAGETRPFQPQNQAGTKQQKFTIQANLLVNLHS